MIKNKPAKQTIESENLGSLEMPSFRDVHGDIPGQIKEGVDRYFGSNVSENSNDIHAIDADVCRSVIEECLEYFLEKKKLATTTLKTISTTPKDKLFNKLNDKGKVEFEGLLGITEDEFCTGCVWQYCNKYLGPTILTESYTTKGGHFVIHHTGCLSDKTIEALEEILDKNFDRVCNFFELTDEEKSNYVTDVYIFEDQEFYNLHAFGIKLNDWGVGSYDYKSLRMLSPDKMQSERYKWQIQTALHEFVHSVSYLNQILREGWTSEGIAEYLSGNKPNEEQLQDALEKFPLTKENLDIIFSDDRDVFYSNPNHKSAYIYACTAMDYVAKKFGEDKIVDIFENEDPDKTPFDVLGVSDKEFKESWYKYVTEGEYIKNLSQDTH